MFGSVVLDVAIGMAFVYLLMSLIASVVQEIIATYLQLRPANLLRGVRSLFSGGMWKGAALADLVYNHGLVRGLYADPAHDDAPAGAVVPATAKEGKAGVKSAVAELSSAESAVKEAYYFVKATEAALDPTATDKDSRERAYENARLTLMEATQRALDAAEKHKGAKTLVKLRVYLASQQGFWRSVARWLARVPTMMPPAGVSSMGVLPAYIPARTFAATMVDLLTPAGTAPADVLGKVKEALDAQRKIAPGDKSVEAIYALALNAGVDSKTELENFKKGLEGWYNDSMDRASGWYKRYTQKILLVVGLALACCFNVDSVRVARTLWFDRDSRQAMVNAATEYTKQHPNPAGTPVSDGDKKTPSSPEDLKKKLDESANAFKQATNEGLLPVGWKKPPLDYLHGGWDYLFPAKDADGKRADRQWNVILPTTWRCLALLTGWLITGMAISLGAPFWFDTLNKFMVVRSTVKPQEKSRTEGSKD
jgi:hypothetical protein